MTTRWIIGLSSGSSADGVDAALLEADGVGLELRVRPMQAVHQPYSPDLRDLLRRIGPTTPQEIKEIGWLHRVLGESFAAAARQVTDRAGVHLQKVQCLGCAGHTCFHDSEGRFPTTLTLGMAAVTAERTGVTTVSDFRSRDLAAGGQGAPLAALADFLLFRHPQENRLLLHLGSMARVVYLPAACRIPQVIAFEAAPCNWLLDRLMWKLSGGREAFDPGGRHAVQGRCLESLLKVWLGHPALSRRPPLCVSRQSFGDEFAAQAVQAARQNECNLHDLLCTATHFVARATTTSLRRWLPGLSPAAGTHPTRVLLSGGGARNGLLLHLLEQNLAGITLEKTDAAGVPVEARKPLTVGILAALTLDGVAGNVPSATGAAGTRLLGSLTPGSTGNWVRCLGWMAAQQLPLKGAD